MEVWPGRPFPLGATWDGEGTNFSLFSEHAERVELCLFDGERETRVEVRDVTAHNWHCYIPGIGPGQRYGYRTHGPYEPEAGQRLHPKKHPPPPHPEAIPVPGPAARAHLRPHNPPLPPDGHLHPRAPDHPHPL